MLKHAHTRTGFSRDGGASAGSRAAVRAWRIAGGRGEGFGRHPSQCPPLVPYMEGEGTGRAQRGGPRGPEAAAGGGAARDRGPGAATGAARARLQHRPVDLAAGRHAHRGADRGATPSRPCLAALAQVGLVAPTTHAARARTRRASDPGMEDAAVAAAKKNARRRHAWLVFEDETASRSSWSSAGPGRRAARPRS
jgi:hypothetical protein